MSPNDADGMANSVHPDHSDLGLRCLLRPVCQKTYENCGKQLFTAVGMPMEVKTSESAQTRYMPASGDVNNHLKELCKCIVYSIALHIIEKKCIYS